MKKKWHNLSDLRRHFIETGEEEVISFNGHELVTRSTLKKNTRLYKYTLALGQLRKEEI